MDRSKAENVLKVLSKIPMVRNSLIASRSFWEFAGGFVAVTGCYYYFTGKATTPGAMVHQAASDIKSMINTVASRANNTVDTVVSVIPK